MIEPVSGTQPQQAPATNALGQLGSDAFLNLLVAQMRYQNPMAPSDGSAMLQQTAQFTTVETLQAISEANQRLMGFQQITMAMSVVGKRVEAITLDGATISGTVDTVRFTADGPMLKIGASEVPMDNVLTVSEAPEAATGGQ
jgi:flagellar basal-body rod modification protein FlgD